MTRVKICGITNATDRDAAIAAGTDALGFTVAVSVDTPREIPVERAIPLIAGVPPFVTTVLVTMPDTPDDAIALVEETNPDAIQIHSTLSLRDIETIKNTITAKVIVAVDATNPDHVHEYEDVADALIVDSTRNGGGGGTGRTHDWEITRDLKGTLSTPVILAGGLTPSNVTDAIRTVDPYAVDVASGVQRSPDDGRKDHQAVRTFIANAKANPVTS